MITLEEFEQIASGGSRTDEQAAVADTRGAVTGVLLLLAIPVWLYLSLGGTLTASKILVMLAGYLVLAVLADGRAAARGSSTPKSPRGPLRTLPN